MTPEEITRTHEVLASQLDEQVANDTASIGNAQRSLGVLAAAVASPSNQTSGLANYTYNRAIRPRVDQLRDSMIVQGLNMSLNRELQNRLLAAQQAQQRAQQNYYGGSSGNTATSSDVAGTDSISGVEEIDTGSGMAAIRSLPMDDIPEGSGSIRSTVMYMDNEPYVLIENNSDRPYTFNGVTIPPGGSQSFRAGGR